MAFQRPFLISLKKNDPHQPWGFKVFGGRDYEEPHIVQKIAPDSVAEHSGLREGDEIIQIGRVNIQDLTFSQVQELIARCGTRIEMFIIREDLLTPRSNKEPPCIKAVVHNPYNSPLQLYSTENIADALARQTEVLTDGRISNPEEEEGPENLTFKQKSAVFHLLEEQAKKESSPQVYSRRSPQRKAPPPPPPKPKPPAQVTHYEQAQTPQSPQRHTTTAVITPTQPVQSSHPLSNQSAATISFKVTSKAYSSPQTDSYQPYPQTQSFKVGPPPPPRSSSQSQAAMTTVQRQQQQQYHQQAQYQQQYQQVQQEQQSFYPQQQQVDYQQQQNQMDYQQQVHRQQEVYQPVHHYQPQPPPQQPSQQQYQHKIQYQTQNHYQPQHHYQPQQYQAPQFNEQEREEIFEPITTTNTPITYKAPPPQKYKVSWPPQENGSLRQMTPSPTSISPSKMPVSSVWPPRQPVVKELPRTGFNPAVLREQGTGRRCVWPPPKADDELRSGRTTPQSPVGGRRINWNPSPSPPTTRRCPFGSTSPQTRRKDIAWPPPQPTGNKENLPRASPRLSRKSGRFEDHVKLQASNNVPTTYRPPPGTSFRHVEQIEYTYS